MNKLVNEVKNTIKDNNISPDKILGQNFLINENVCSKIIDISNIQPDDTVVEVGAGFGTLTKYIAKKAKRVIAVEKSEDMIGILKKETSEFLNIEIVHQDILKFNPEEYGLSNIKYNLIGAPPYYLTARLFRVFLQNNKHIPASITLLIQKEVADKISQTSPKGSLIGNSVQIYGEIKTSQSISQNAFYPQPSVESKIIHIDNIKKPSIDEKVFFKVLRSGFSNPRKQILKNLSNGLDRDKSTIQQMLESVAIDTKTRPETLSIQDWIHLTQKYQ